MNFDSIDYHRAYLGHEVKSYAQRYEDDLRFANFWSVCFCGMAWHMGIKVEP
jgi:hypothetical protein